MVDSYFDVLDSSYYRNVVECLISSQTFVYYEVHLLKKALEMNIHCQGISFKRNNDVITITFSEKMLRKEVRDKKNTSSKC